MVQTQPQDESDVKLLSAMKDYGGHVVGTAEDDDGPDYAFTAGMFQTHEAPIQQYLLMRLGREQLRRLPMVTSMSSVQKVI